MILKRVSKMWKGLEIGLRGTMSDQVEGNLQMASLGSTMQRSVASIINGFNLLSLIHI